MKIAVGTEKGAYVFEESGGGWSVAGPMFPGWKVSAFGSAQGAIRPHVSVFVDGLQADPGTRLREGSEVRVLHAVSGGSPEGSPGRLDFQS